MTAVTSRGLNTLKMMPRHTGATPDLVEPALSIDGCSEIDRLARAVDIERVANPKYSEKASGSGHLSAYLTECLQNIPM